MKRCTKCGLVQPRSAFYAAKGTRDGLRGDCKGCFRARAAERYRQNPEPVKRRARQWAIDNPEKRADWQRRYRESGRRQRNDRRSYLKRTHGITVAQYDEMLAAQGGVCAICGRPPREDISLHVDHDHATGERRGLLCFRCNNSLGDLSDDPELVANVATYLIEHDPEMKRLKVVVKQRLEELGAAS